MCFGLKYSSIIEQLPPPEPTIDGPRQGRQWKIYKIIIDTVASLGIKYGTPRKVYDLFRREISDGPGDQQMALRSGRYMARGDFRWKGEDALRLQVDDPFPASILSIMTLIEGTP